MAFTNPSIDVRSYRWGLACKEVVKDLAAWVGVVLFVMVLVGLQVFASCSGTPKATITMNNCVVVQTDSPQQGSINLKCDLAAEDKATLTQPSREP